MPCPLHPPTPPVETTMQLQRFLPDGRAERTQKAMRKNLSSAASSNGAHDDDRVSMPGVPHVQPEVYATTTIIHGGQPSLLPSELKPARKGRSCWPFGRKKGRMEVIQEGRERELLERRRMMMQEEASRRDAEHRSDAERPPFLQRAHAVASF